MPKKVIEVAKGPKPVGPYSPAVRVGDFVYVSGQGGVDPSSGKFGGDVKAQTKRTSRKCSDHLGSRGPHDGGCVQGLSFPQERF